ncbi:beta-ketoacyl synthase N-terminal-like domain-containing protein [uncultured Shewanella sp.]|uniref:hotdog fold thioesterase n=1 Tax=uncultured Shewanella sp. TaxID=173975 RepID=UPI0026125ADA|nr:beta-ketoacyl synthase N-terminal-like domain-containing protein [uncultured Shewanella sp.]
MSSRKPPIKNKNSIAIVGLAALYPDANSPQTFWQNLKQKKDARSPLTAKKLNAEISDYQGQQGQSDRFYCDKGGYIQDFHFDPSGYHVAAKELVHLDDSLKWALHTCSNALKDANIALNESVLARTGIIMGTLSFPTQKSNHQFLPLYHSVVEKALQATLFTDQSQAVDFTLTPFSLSEDPVNQPQINKAQQPTHLKGQDGNIAHNASNIISEALSLKGPQLSLDAACASSVYSLKLACDYLHTHKADMMLAGAVSGTDPFFINMGFSIFHAYPEHGAPKNEISAPFDTKSQGLFAGEGAGVLVLKRLDDAIRDEDHIYALIDSIGLSNDGKGKFVLSPNSKGQVNAFERAYSASSISPSQVEVIECHATGTPLGDKVELTSMEDFFIDKLDGSAAPLIGSAKSNLGHLLTAAGMPGIMKMIFAMKTGNLPPSINIESTIQSPKGLFGQHNIPTQVTPWPSKQVPAMHQRHAGVSVFGFGGCNAHLILNSYKETNDVLKNHQSTDKQQTTSTASTYQALAITGIAAHFGPLNDIHRFNQAIEQDQHAFITLPEQRWKGIDKHPDILQQFGLSSAPKGAYIGQFDLDFLRFKLPPNDDDRLIPQQLLLMKVADEAIIDANLTAGQNVAVLVAMETELELHQFRGRVNLHSQLAQSLEAHGITLTKDEYQTLESITMDSVLDAAKLNQYTSFIGNIMASRIAALWDFNGPAFTISAAEQSVNRCIDVAQNLMAVDHIDCPLKHDPLQAVVIAAVDLSGSIEQVMIKSRVQKVAQNPNGAPSISNKEWAIGEGAGAIVLRPQNAMSNNLDSYGSIDNISFNVQPNTRSLRNIDLLETNIAPSLNPTALIEAAHQLGTCYPQAEQTQASHRMGHSFAASGMGSLLHALLTLNKHNRLIKGPLREKTALIATFMDKQSSQILLKQNEAQQTALMQKLTHHKKTTTSTSRLSPSNKPTMQVIKQVILGGRDIYQHIATVPPSLKESIKNSINNRTQKNIQPRVTDAITHVTQSTTTTSILDNSQPNTMKKTSTPAPPNPIQQQQEKRGSHLTQLQANQTLTQQAHSAFLESRSAGLKVADALLRSQLTAQSKAVQSNTAQANIQHTKPSTTVPPTAVPPTTATALSNADMANVEIASTDRVNTETVNYVPPVPEPKPCIWDYHDLVEYAEGDIANVFGPEYAVIDQYSRRVRLPTTDYLLVSRVTKIDAKINQYRPSTMTTEYDIPKNAPYLVDGQIPWAVAVESGQCDLMLISYLGIDFENKGERVYRLLDCTLTFLGDLPRGGDTLRYDISINHFARNGETLLFFFSYRCYVNDTLILKMDNGCAGFFTDAELSEGKGVIRTDAELKARLNAFNGPKQHFLPLLDCPQTQFDHQAIRHLLSANLEGCFGHHYAQEKQQKSLCFASEKFLMIETVSHVDHKGGAWGLGVLEGQKQLAPEHWYFPCHFKDDPVMAGSLMAEGCGQLLQFYMLYLGMHTHTKNGRFQPLENAAQQVRCRGQVLPQTAILTYKMEVTEIGLSPYPYAKANIDILLDGKVVVDFQHLGVMIKEESECTLYGKGTPEEHTLAGRLPQESTPKTNPNAPLMQKIPNMDASLNKGVRPLIHTPAPIIKDYPNRQPDTLPFTPFHLFEFATGDIEQCFGPDFAIYRGLIPPRTPCGDLQLTTRVIDIKGTRGELNKPASCIAEYEVPDDAWYFSQNNHQANMPYAILMEIALQPNGFISGYMGTTLGFPGEELFFRNLDGKGQLLREVDLRDKTIVNDSRLLSTVIAGSNIIQSFTFELSCDNQAFYVGEAVFGYFKASALKDQLGLDKGQTTQPWHIVNEVKADHHIDLQGAAVKPNPYFIAPKNQPHYKLAGGQLNFIDKVDIVEKGGSHGLGYLFAQRTINPSDWFFQFHFHQDPVMPGSLGVQAIIELMQTYAINQGLGKTFTNPKFEQILSKIQWKYRGQINPLNKQMSLDVHITAIEKTASQITIIGNANLSKDGLRIYEVTDIAIGVVEA